MTKKSYTLSRFSYPDTQGQVSLAGGKIYILPTRIGMIYGMAVTTMLLGSLNYVSNMGLAFTFLFGSVALVGMIHTWRNLLDLRIEAVDAPPVFLGQPATFTVRITEPKLLDRGAIVVAIEGAQSLWGSNSTNTALAVDLSAGSSVDIELTPIPLQRGNYHLGLLCISSTFPLGLFRAWAYAQTNVKALVYPTPATTQKWHPTMRFVPAIQGGGGAWGWRRGFCRFTPISHW